MKLRISTIELSLEDLEALAYRIDGNRPSIDAPTGRKCTRAEAVFRLEQWISDELSEARRELDDAKMNWEP